MSKCTGGCGKSKTNCCCIKNYRGEKGPAGDRGPRGLTGPTGPAGPSGGGDWFAISIYGSGTTAYKIITAGSYAAGPVARVQYPGSANVTAVLSAVRANVWRVPGNGASSIRVYDITNSLVIAEVTGIVATSNDNIETLTVTPANVSATPAVWEIQMFGLDGGISIETGVSSVSFKSV